ncbi:MOSC domain-containing protein [Waterburya agarophytonicola K14]|uniref:MOSC domain-containing protein n=1 Tax=Waterburya agarophytonicola KI4 TaxID=2874699 RepID=A0A964BXE7_9CYAN|nr:MOSC N-terminal beta barrel domain-containing protein [Waterburya agarophytonicola]MCC0179105.1 MOSC domain-containing protein [Waterburya agarophytonicola KI4]
MIVSQLCVYPIKSCQRIDLSQAEVNTKGFLGDREMMLISGSGKFITQRQFPQLAKVRVEIADGDITLSLEDGSFPSLTFTAIITGTTIEVEIWRDRLQAIDQGDLVAAWFHQLLNLDRDKVCRLVKQSPEYTRLAAKNYPSEDNIPLGFLDNYPVMLTATASLQELNQRITEIHLSQKQVIPMNRFRPNIVINTTEPFIEDRWSLIQIGEIEFTVAKPCSRCIMTTIDQQQGQKNQLKEPLNTLGTFRQLSEQGVMFGMNMIPKNQGIMKLGDRLKVLETRS